MNTYADAWALAWSELKRNRTAAEPARKPRPTGYDFTLFLREKIIPEIKRMAVEINTSQAGLRARWALFPDGELPGSAELLLAAPWIKGETFLSFRVEPDDFNGGGVSWYTSDNPICKKLDTTREDAVEELIVKFVSSLFHRTAGSAGVQE